jgi:proteasome lid subunit RPN8/RPN11
MTLILGPGILEAVTLHLCAAYPEEGCGLLLGTLDHARDRRIAHACVATPNRWQPAAARGRHFLIEAEDVVRAERQARRSGWDLIGVFHSHPDYAAMPSPEDRQNAWPGLSYLIASVSRFAPSDHKDTPSVAKISSLFCWVFDSERRTFHIEALWHNLSAQNQP